MTWLFRFIVFVILFTAVRAVLSHLFGWSQGRQRGAQRRNARPSAGSMRSISHPVIKDPICGTYVDRDLALPLHSGEETLYFCSEKCREEYSRRVSAGVR
jgi:YHS domain-containing protein